MKKFLLSALVIFIIILNSTNLYAGAWTQKSKSGFYKLGLRYISATNYYDLEGDKREIPKLTDLLISLYGEYGLNNEITIILNMGILESIKINDLTTNGTIISSGGSNSGLADSEIGLRYKLWQGDGSVLSTEFFLGIPVGNTNNALGLYTGDGEFNQNINILYGMSFYPIPLYLSVQAGYSNRTGGFSDEIKFATEIGFNLIPNILLALKINGVETLDNGSKSVFGGSYLHSNNQKYIAFGPELSYSFSNSLGISVGFESAANAANVPSALAYAIGLYFKH